MADISGELSINSGIITGLIVSMFLAIAVPVGFAVLMRVKYRAKFKNFFIGVITFAAFVLILEGLFNGMVGGVAARSLSGNSYRVFYIAHGALTAGIFGETARFFAFRYIIKDRDDDFSAAFMYGLGHGGIESIITGLSIILYIALAIAVNTFGFTGTLDFLSLQDAERSALADVITTLADTPAGAGYAEGVERMLTLAAHCSLSFLVYMAVSGKGPRYYYPLAIALHTVFNIPPAMYEMSVITDIWLIESLSALLCAGLVLLVYTLWKKQGLSGAAAEKNALY